MVWVPLAGLKTQPFRWAAVSRLRSLQLSGRSRISYPYPNPFFLWVKYWEFPAVSMAKLIICQFFIWPA